MTDKNKKIKFISILLIILILAPAVLFSAPKKAQAQWYVLDGTNLIANIFTGSTSSINTGHTITTALIAIAKQAVMVIERRLLQELTKGITGWINSGFHGSPLFLTNSDSFFNDIAKSEVKNIVDDFGYDPNSFPFGEQFALNTINAYKRTADQDAAYSLSTVMNQTDANNFRNNFNAGGWNGFLINTQYPQNNYLGFNMMATDKLARQLQGTTQNAAQKITTTLNQGMGFLSPQTCPSDINPDYDNGINEFQKPDWQSSDAYNNFIKNYPPDPNAANDAVYELNSILGVTQTSNPETQSMIDSYNAQFASAEATAKAAFDKKNTCKKADGSSGLVNTTPGSVAANQIFTALGVDVSKSELGSMVEGSLSAILNTLVSHFLDQGVTALGSAINGSSGATDSWSYQGNTLVTNSTAGGTTTTTPANTTLSISPASVSVFPGNAVNGITISGGTPPYYLLGNCDNGGAGTTSNVTQASCMATTSGAGTWDPADPQFVSVSANSDGTLTVIGLAASTSGTTSNTSVTIQDSSSPAQIITLPITITATATTTPITTTPTDNPVGTCTIGGHPTDGVTQSDCGNLGTWSPTLPPDQDPWGNCTLGDGSPAPSKQSDCLGWGGVWNPTPPSATSDSLGTCSNIVGTSTKSTCEANDGIWTANQSQ